MDFFPLYGSYKDDLDGDGVPDICDNCPEHTTDPNQADRDGDGLGDICDKCRNDLANDADRDGLCGDVDPCPSHVGIDNDGDGVCDDNCPDVANADQRDTDGNGIGDACQTGPTCDDGIDNDGDGLIDYPRDPGCMASISDSERAPRQVGLPCDDGVDNDSDGRSDFRANGAGDPGCKSPSSPREDPECNDGIDNDGDGATDFDGYFSMRIDPACVGRGWFDDESALDGPDQDGDGYLDSVDPCIHSFDFLPPPEPGSAEDLDGDGIPSECQCGDTNGDGLIREADALAITRCVDSPDYCYLDVAISEANNNGIFDAADALAVSAVAAGTTPAHTLTCAARPEGSPPGQAAIAQ